MFKSILVPTDGSPIAEKVFGPAIAAAKNNDGRLVAVCVAPPGGPHPTEGSVIPDYGRQYEQDVLRSAQQNAQRLVDAACAAGVPCETVVTRSDDPAGEIVRAAEQFGCDVIFIASHGRRGISRLFAGSETQRVLAESRIPVLVFPEVSRK